MGPNLWFKGAISLACLVAFRLMHLIEFKFEILSLTTDIVTF